MKWPQSKSGGYVVTAEIVALINIGSADAVGARMLWCLGLYGQALWLLQQSAEKLLKAAWARHQTFADAKDFEKRLKKFGHDIEKVYKALNHVDRSKIKHGIAIVKPSTLRYRGSWGTSYKRFREGELFVQDVRKLLGLKKPKSHLDAWKTAANIGNGFSSAHQKTIRAAKAVLAASHAESKKERREKRRKHEFVLREVVRRMQETMKPKP